MYFCLYGRSCKPNFKTLQVCVFWGFRVLEIDCAHFQSDRVTSRPPKQAIEVYIERSSWPIGLCARLVLRARGFNSGRDKNFYTFRMDFQKIQFLKKLSYSKGTFRTVKFKFQNFFAKCRSYPIYIIKFSSNCGWRHLEVLFNVKVEETII